MTEGATAVAVAVAPCAWCLPGVNQVVFETPVRHRDRFCVWRWLCVRCRVSAAAAWRTTGAGRWTA